MGLIGKIKKYTDLESSWIANGILITAIGTILVSGIYADYGSRNDREVAKQRVIQARQNHVMEAYDLNSNGVIDSVEVKQIFEDFYFCD